MIYKVNINKITRRCFCFFIISMPSSVFASESANQFTYFDNNVTLGYNYSIIQNNAEFSMVGINATALLHDNIWLSAAAGAVLTFDLSNNNQGLSNLNQNHSGSSLNLKAGYAFIFDTLNVTPYLGFAYNNMLIAYNYDSTQEFILENPSYSILAGANIEYVVIEKKLKLGLDTGFSYAMYKSVLPNSNTSLGHVNYSQYLVNITPSIQYNINSLLTVMGYYGFSSKFAGNAAPQSVYYPNIDVNSSNVINNDGIINSFGLRFGILF